MIQFLNGDRLEIAWIYLFVAFLLRYTILAGLAYLVVWRWLPDRFAKIRIQESVPASGHLRREILYSLGTIFIFSLLGILTVTAASKGFMQIYTDHAEYGTAYFFISILLMMVLHDAFFYWAHRAMHHPLLYRRVHLVHHLSTNPSPWAAFAFHPYESLVEGIILPLIAFVLPVHIHAVIIFLIIMTALNVLGHLGYEFYPRGTVTHPLFRWLNTSTHHNMHHRYVHHNFGLYFNWWDSWMKTNHPNYIRAFQELKSDSKRI